MTTKARGFSIGRSDRKKILRPLSPSTLAPLSIKFDVEILLFCKCVSFSNFLHSPTSPRGDRYSRSSAWQTLRVRSRSAGRGAISKRICTSAVAAYATSTRTSEMSSVAGPSRQAATLSKIDCFISCNGSRESSRTKFRIPSTPSISPRASKTSVMPSV